MATNSEPQAEAAAQAEVEQPNAAAQVTEQALAAEAEAVVEHVVEEVEQAVSEGVTEVEHLAAEADDEIANLAKSFIPMRHKDGNGASDQYEQDKDGNILVPANEATSMIEHGFEVAGPAA
jgi:hypothetical protein